MTPKQRAEFDRLKKRNAFLERRNRGITKARIDRLIWLLLEIESVCPRPGLGGQIRVRHSDAKMLRPLVDAIVSPPEVK